MPTGEAFLWQGSSESSLKQLSLHNGIMLMHCPMR